MGETAGVTISKAIVIHPENRQQPSSRPPQLMLEEAGRLVEAIGLEIAHAAITGIARPKAGTYLGSGYAAQLAELAKTEKAGLIVINTALSAIQQRNLEQLTGAKVIDRTALILEIFGARAVTHSGRLQVELAALSFQRSRLVRSWTHLERQRGGGGFLGGPGERQIELDRRLLMQRINRLKQELKEVERTRRLQRRNRDRSETPTIALIGYTNAGKSTLFNILTGAGVLARDMLFATLDPTMRALVLPSGRQVVLADTVGFISALPTTLVEAFKSTLEEVTEADLLLHVHDASSPMQEQEAADVKMVLMALGLSEETLGKRVIHVLNKADLLAGYNRPDGFAMPPDAVLTSATRGDGIRGLLAAIETRLDQGMQHRRLLVPVEQAAAVAWLHRHAQIDRITILDDGGQEILCFASTADWARFSRQWPALGGQGETQQT